MSGPGIPVPYPCEALPFNHLAFKGSHNSYEWVDEHQGTSLATLLEFDPGKPAEFGCRGLELDLVYTRRRDTPDDWEVRHEDGYRPPLGHPKRWASDHTKPLSYWLRQLRKWGKADEQHDPITVVLDLKDSGGIPLEQTLDPYLRKHLKASIVQPNEVREGWPTLGELRGRWIFVVSGGSSDEKKTYAKLPDAMCFVDRDPGRAKTVPNTDKDPRWFINWGAKNTRNIVLDVGRRSNRLMLRLYGIANERNWNDVLERGTNMLSCDFMTGTPWASVSGGANPCPFVESGAERD